ncbi:MAG UNVERIFIED_CONTAM: hypothetical protein LVT10_15165 [Anaerolineae bacterium]
MNETALKELATQISACQRCSLHTGRTRTVPVRQAIPTQKLCSLAKPLVNEKTTFASLVGRSGEYLNYLLGEPDSTRTPECVHH